MTIDRSGDRPLYKQLADVLREAIQRSDFPAGTTLPSEVELIERYQVARNTVRSAIAQLRVEGVVATEHGHGTYVRERRPLRRLSSTRYSRVKREARRAPLTAEAQERGSVSGQTIREIGMVQAPPEIADRLDLESGATVVVRRHLLTLDGVPVQLADSYFPFDIAQGTQIDQSAKIQGGVHAYLELDLGHELDKFVEELTFRMPTPEEARLLHISTGIPVVRMLRTLYGKAGRPIEVSDFLLAGDKHELVYETSAG